MQLQLLESSSVEMSVLMNILGLVTPIVPSGTVLEIFLLGGVHFHLCYSIIYCFIFIFFTYYKLISMHVDFSGSGAAMDVVVSSVRAYLSALNKMSSFIGALNASSEAPEAVSVQTSE
jgi:hypothetical protein